MSGRPGKECHRLLRELANKSKARGDKATSQKFNRLASQFQKITGKDGSEAAAPADAPLSPKAYNKPVVDVPLAIPNNIVKRADLADSQTFILSTVEQTFRLNYAPELDIMVLSTVSGRYKRADEARAADVDVIDKNSLAPEAVVYMKHRFAPLVAWKIGSQNATGQWFGTADRTKPFLALIPGENAFVVDHGSYTYTVFAKEAFVVTTQDPVLCVVGGADDPVLLTRNHAIAQLVEGGSFTAVPLGALYSKRVGNITALELVNIVTSNLSTGFDVHSLKTRLAFQQAGTDDIDDGYYAW